MMIQISHLTKTVPYYINKYNRMLVLPTQYHGRTHNTCKNDCFLCRGRQRETVQLYTPVECHCWVRKCKGFCRTSFSSSLRIIEFLRKSFLLKIKAFLLHPTTIEQETSMSLWILYIQGLCFMYRGHSQYLLSGQHHCE